MILFKPEHVAPILDGRKTQTRRLGKKRWNVGAVHQGRATMFGPPFAHLHILGVRQEQLDKVSEEDARREGYSDRDEYLEAFERINWKGSAAPGYWQQLVWVVDFKLEVTPK